MVSSTIGIWVENGSRYETPAENGVSHFIEHLLFKGTRKRTAAQIAEQIDAVGGVLNAFTGKEYTCYYAKVLGADLPMTTELLADLFLESVFDAAEIDRERQVVLQEISQAEDTPDDFIHDLFNLKFWEGHPLALPIFGSVATVNAINRELLVSFMADRYRAGRVFIAAAGMVDHERLVDDCARLFGGVSGDGRSEPITPPRDRTVVINQEKDLEQTHICIGGPGISQAITAALRQLRAEHGARAAGCLRGCSRKCARRRGRVYSIYSFMSSFIDSGYLGIYAGTNPEWVEEVLEVTLGEVNKVARDGLTNEELARAKSQLKGNMLLGMESTDSRMNRVARNEIYFGREIPLEELANEIDKVTNDQVLELAATSFLSDKMALVLLGDLKGHKFGPDVFSELK